MTRRLELHEKPEIMAYHYEWLVPKRVIFSYMSGTVDMPQAHQALAELGARLDSGQAPTHYVADLRHSQKMPTTNFREVQVLSSFVHHPHLGWIVVIGKGNLPVNFVLTVVARLTGVRYRAVDTPQEALAFLANIDPTLNLDVDLEAFYAKFMQESR